MNILKYNLEMEKGLYKPDKNPKSLMKKKKDWHIIPHKNFLILYGKTPQIIST